MYLDKYVDMFENCVNDIQKDIGYLSDDDLEELIKEAITILKTNCSWTSYRVIKIVLKLALEEQEIRDYKSKINI